ncbi:MAG: hypothetical protein NWF04_05120 [Candidatus Bathyarchaeota archaeon]|nr:hypothetical protein [Candidatus Bathyarchaeota archaeon]
MMSSSPHVPQNTISSFGEFAPNQTSCTTILVGPVGVGKIAVGYFTLPGSTAPSVPGFENVTLPIHLEITAPNNQTLIETCTTTPDIFPINFDSRGQYCIYVTNCGNQTSSLPIGVAFEAGNPQNIEADKYALAVFLTASGAVLTAINLVRTFIFKRRRP